MVAYLKKKQFYRPFLKNLICQCYRCHIFTRVVDALGYSQYKPVFTLLQSIQKKKTERELQ